MRDEALREKGLEIVFNHQGVNYVNRFEAMLSDGNQVAKTTITND